MPEFNDSVTNFEYIETPRVLWTFCKSLTWTKRPLIRIKRTVASTVSSHKTAIKTNGRILGLSSNRSDRKARIRPLPSVPGYALCERVGGYLSLSTTLAFQVFSLCGSLTRKARSCLHWLGEGCSPSTTCPDGTSD